MNIGLFGGTFDPIHRGHLAIARAAATRFKLKQVHFAPTGVPPHRGEAADFSTRYAMTVLATAADKWFIPSLIDAPVAGRRSYSLYTVRSFKASLKKTDRLFFLVGIDQFLEISTWHKPVELLCECEFIIAARPGHSMAEIGQALPRELRPSETVLRASRRQPASGGLMLPGVRLHLMTDTSFDVSATQVREALQRGRGAARWLTPEVSAFLAKTGVYGAAKRKREQPQAGPARKIAGAKVLQFKKSRRRT